MKSSVLPLRADHLPAATALLTDAFIGDIGMRAICRATTDTHYRQCLTAWFRATLHMHIAMQHPAWAITVGDKLVGAALLTRPRAPFAPHAWLGWVMAVGARCGWGVVWRTAHHERQRAAHRPAQPHAVLEFIAVHADYRGQGYATLLFDTIWQWSATQAQPAGIWLETTRLPNVPLFEHLGYTVTGRMPLEQGESRFLFRARD